MKPRVFIRAADEFATPSKSVAAPILRKSFVLDFVPEEADLAISASGFYELFINGQKITKGFLAPYISDPEHCVYYDVYDIAAYLRQGQNAVTVILGNGFVNQILRRRDYRYSNGHAPLVTAIAMKVSGQDKTFVLETDDTFKVHSSAILFDMYRHGVVYDAREEIAGFADANFDDSAWEYAKLSQPPAGVLRLSTALPVREQYQLAPVSIEKQEDFYYLYDADNTPLPQGYVKRGWVYDFGYNCAGVCRMKVKGERGQKIILRHGETLRDGRFDMSNIIDHRVQLELFQSDTYILKGGEEEIFVPPFTYHGFRYVLVEGITEEQATPELLTYIVFNTDLRKRSDFRCSDETVNTLYEMAIRSDLSNFQHFPTDCPTREKSGWTGDVSVSAEQLVLSFDCSENFRMWQENFSASQLEDGMLPCIVPCTGPADGFIQKSVYGWGTGPAWDSAAINVPFFCYQYDHREDMIRESSDMMYRYLQYIAGRRDEKGLIACGLGDWCQPYSGNVNISSPLCFTDSTQIYEVSRRAAYLFGVIGQEERRAYALQLMKEMRDAVRASLIDYDTMTVAGSCQTSQAVALSMGIFEPEEYERAYARLIDFIKEKNYYLDCGMIGLRHIFHVLFQHGDGDIALKMMCQEEAPSYANMIKLGGTALFESLIPNGVQKSQNHHFYGDIINLFITKLAGLQINPDLDDIHHVVAAPCIPDGISFAEASYSFGEDEVRIKWEKQDAKVIISADVPAVADGVLRFAGQEIPLRTGHQEFAFAM
ncbi:MAG: hypothetical protein E7286_07715 [Lachnospiraceae bacterium]|nr:hypothetical protein [Lachnospiraceae bacterium]